MLRGVASHADWWNLGRTLEEYRNKLEVLKRHCENVGKSYEAIMKMWVDCLAIAKTEDEALMIAKNNPSGTNQTTIIGGPEQVSQRLAEFVDLGAEYFIRRFLDYPSPTGAEIFAEKVAGNLRNAAVDPWVPFKVS